MANKNNLNTISNKKFFLKALLCFFFIFFLFQTSEGSVRLCGYRLSKMLITVCRSHHCPKDLEYENHGRMEKRSIVEEVNYGDEENLSKDNMYNLPPIKRGGGVVNDCCINRCTIEHLKTYCCGYADEEVDF